MKTESSDLRRDGGDPFPEVRAVLTAKDTLQTDDLEEEGQRQDAAICVKLLAQNETRLGAIEHGSRKVKLILVIQ